MPVQVSAIVAAAQWDGYFGYFSASVHRQPQVAAGALSEPFSQRLLSYG
jgi:hypothetical protein